MQTEEAYLRAQGQPVSVLSPLWESWHELQVACVQHKPQLKKNRQEVEKELEKEKKKRQEVEKELDKEKKKRHSPQVNMRA